MANAEVARSAVATRSALLLARDGESEARKPHPMKAAVGERSAVPRKLFSGGPPRVVSCTRRSHAVGAEDLAGCDSPGGLADATAREGCQ